MFAILTLLTTLVVTILITRIGSISLKLTGLSMEVAMFQARSAFSGAGFTSVESEMVVNHPVRRRIIMLLMTAGNLGIAAVVATSIASFSSAGNSTSEIQSALLQRLGVLTVGILVIGLLSRSRLVNSIISKTIEYALVRWTHLNVTDYESLLNLAEGFVVGEISVPPNNWLESRSLAESALSMEGVLVLGVRRRSGKFIGSPVGKTTIRSGDRLMLYGTRQRIDELSGREKGTAGDRAHRIATRIQHEMVTEMTRHD